MQIRRADLTQEVGSAILEKYAVSRTLLTVPQRIESRNRVSKCHQPYLHRGRICTKYVLIPHVNRVTFIGIYMNQHFKIHAELSCRCSNGVKAVDRHPERRLKAAYAAFEAENLDRLKKENPTLRLSQIKQLLCKEWMKSPANPLNSQ